MRLCLLGVNASSDSKDNTYRHAQANQVSDKLGKSRLRVVQHGHGGNGAEEQYFNSGGHHKPKKQRAGQAPDQARARGSGASCEESTESEAKNSSKQDAVTHWSCEYFALNC